LLNEKDGIEERPKSKRIVPNDAPFWVYFNGINWLAEGNKETFLYIPWCGYYLAIPPWKYNRKMWWKKEFVEEIIDDSI